MANDDQFRKDEREDRNPDESIYSNSPRIENAPRVDVKVDVNNTPPSSDQKSLDGEGDRGSPFVYSKTWILRPVAFLIGAIGLALLVFGSNESQNRVELPEGFTVPHLGIRFFPVSSDRWISDLLTARQASSLGGISFSSGIEMDSPAPLSKSEVKKIIQNGKFSSAFSDYGIASLQSKDDRVDASLVESFIAANSGSSDREWVTERERLMILDVSGGHDVYQAYTDHFRSEKNPVYCRIALVRVSPSVTNEQSLNWNFAFGGTGTILLIIALILLVYANQIPHLLFP